MKRARAGRPPQLVVASVLRLAGHGEHDDASYVPTEMKGRAVRAGLRATRRAIHQRTGTCLTPQTFKQWRAESSAEVDEAVATAQHEAAPEGEEEDWCAVSQRELVDHPEGDE